VANKVDLPAAVENLPRLAQEFPGVSLVAVSASQKVNLKELTAFLDGEVGQPG
jgi:50S ribosomal subunit-associated GTPase HflX